MKPAISVFLADDHAVLRDGLRAMLGMQPEIEVVGVSGNGHEAVLAVVALCPDVAVLDISMPEMDGLEATRRIVQRCPQSRVIILSMHNTSGHVRQALRAGARGYLLKEEAGEEVVTAVRAVHAGRRYFSKEIAEAIVVGFAQERESATDCPLDQLTAREQQVLPLLVEGHGSNEIAESLCLSPRTVDTYRRRILQKLDIPSLPGLVKFALKHGLTSLE
jgi:DNA-binding NarL/FixJ family response regulator